MKILYCMLWDGEIVVCDAPLGTLVFCPKMDPVVFETRPGGLPGNPPHWKALGLVSRSSVRIPALADDIEATLDAFNAFLKTAVALLPEHAKQGVLGVMMKSPYEFDGVLYRRVGFFYVPYPAYVAWVDEYPIWGKAPEGFPNDL